jgi:hypothetical protein
MTPPELLGGAVALGSLLVLCGRGLNRILRAFHAEHITPSILGVSHEIAQNTRAVSALTAALAETNKEQARGFARLGDIVSEHEKQLGIHATRLDGHSDAIDEIRRPRAATSTPRRKQS